MKKKIFLIAVLCLCMLGLAACSKTDPTTVDYNGYSYDELEAQCQSTVQALVSMSDEDKAYILASGSEETINLMNSWDEVTAEYGAFVEFGDFKVVKSGKTLTAEQTLQLTDRKAVLTYVFTYYNMQVEGITLDAVYSTGEKMGKAGLNTMMGILIVFAVLILISLIISCFKFLSAFEKKEVKSTEDAGKDTVVTQIVQREAQQQDDTELIAVIAAAIAAAEGTSPDGFVVRSIRRR